ncbi:MAG: fibronectin type III domain-containing protein, partial [Candidatus Pacearchaeota archaeon]|nr:fibronectin type III domain-containing protein [Candidatus Pacearchaeota archaeon]
INVSVTDSIAVDTCILEWQGVNETMTMVGSDSGVICWKNKTGLIDGSYAFKVYANDSANNWGSTLTRTVNIDTTAPIITNINAKAITSSSANIVWQTNESANSTVNYGINLSLGTIRTKTLFVLSHSVSLTGLSANTLYYYNVTSCDLAGNCNTTGPFNFTPLAGGGKGYPPSFPSRDAARYCDMTFNLSNYKIATCTIRGHDIIYFTYKDIRHRIFINNIDFEWANITIETEPINLSLLVNETKLVDLDKDGIDDISVTLEKITRNNRGTREATITVKLLLKCDCPECSEWSNCIEGKQMRRCYKCNETDYSCEEIEETKTCEMPVSKINWKLILCILKIILLIILILLVVYLIYKYLHHKRKNKNYKKDHSEKWLKYQNKRGTFAPFLRQDQINTKREKSRSTDESKLIEATNRLIQELDLKEGGFLVDENFNNKLTAAQESKRNRDDLLKELKIAYK